jgi:hypothetical protein
MKRIILLAVVGCLTLGGWAVAQQQELLNHPADVHMQKMDDNTCNGSSSNSSGGG